MFGIFNTNLLTAMGKTIVRKHLNTTNMLLQQMSGQMGNNLAEQQVNNNNNKAKNKMANTRTPLSQFLKTYDLGNFENCELNTDISLIYPCLHPPMYQVCRNPHTRASSSL